MTAGASRHRYHLPGGIVVPAGIPAEQRQRLAAVVTAAISRAVRDATPGPAATFPTGTRPGSPQTAARTGYRDYAVPSYGNDGEKVGIPVADPLHGVEATPTYGNLPRDAPGTIGPVILRRVNGKWREIQTSRPMRTARGNYDFVIQGDTIFAVKSRARTMEGNLAGHTEAAHGGRVTWAGTLHISRSGEITRWDDVSGHYRPDAYLLRQALKEIAERGPDGEWHGLPVAAWRQAEETSARPRPASVAPQLPVFQPRTRSRTGEPAKVPPGPPRLEELERHLRERGPRPPTPDEPPPVQPTPPVQSPAAARQSGSVRAAPAVPAKGDRVVGRIAFAWDTEASGPARLTTRAIDLRDFPPDRPGPISRFFRVRTFAEGLVHVGVSEAAQVISDKAMSLVVEHFTTAIVGARREVAAHFPTGEQLVRDRQLADLAQAADDVINGRSTTLHRSLADNLADLLTYHEALTTTLDEVERYEAEATPIADDLRQRRRVLRDVADNAEQAFAWIHQYLPVLFAYYQSFTLWHVRETFLHFAGQLDSMADLLDSRVTGYRTVFEKLNGWLAALEDAVGDPHTYADELLARGGHPQWGHIGK